MKWIRLICLTLLSLGSIQTIAKDNTSFEMLEDDSEMLALDKEIEALLEEELLEASELQQGEDYDQLDEMIAEKEFIASSEAKNTLAFTPSSKIKIKEEKNLPVALNVDSPSTIVADAPLSFTSIQEETAQSIKSIEINLKQVFAGSPIIYCILFFLSTIAICVWLYSMLTIRSFEFLPKPLLKELKGKLLNHQFEEALSLCSQEKHFFCKILASGILTRKHGLNVILDTMKAEGKRNTIRFWQRINLLNEIAVIAPMLGLLGTVLGMFYAFYDLNRSVESVSLLFDGLGVSVGTTVAGLIVAILAMILYSITKYRLIRILASVENEAQVFAILIDNQPH